jgi:hypothetical protein
MSEEAWSTANGRGRRFAFTDIEGTEYSLMPDLVISVPTHSEGSWLERAKHVGHR